MITAQDQFDLQCTTATSLQKLESPLHLGPLDLAPLASIPIAVVFVYRQDSSNKEVISLHKLQQALPRLLDYYPHLTGRIAINPDDYSAQIEQLGAGAKLISATCDQPLKAFEDISEADKPSRLLAANLPDGGNALLPPFDSTPEGLTRDPILTVQHTRFACGGVAVSVRIRHIICDAAGLFQLVSNLTEIYRGMASGVANVALSNPPEIRSYTAGLHSMSPKERQEALEIIPTGFELSKIQDEASGERTTDTPAPPPVTGRFVRFSADRLRAIKAEVNAGISGKPMSTFIALSAHLYRSVYRARMKLLEAQGMSSNEAAKETPRQFLASLNARQQLELPSRYFFNCLFCSVFSLPVDQLVNGSLSTVAASLRDSIRVPDTAELQQSARWIAAQPDKRRVQLNYHPEEGGFQVSQWSKFGMYRSAVFECSPALVMQPFTPINLWDGLVYIMGTEDELTQSADSFGITAGSLDVSLALTESVWALLEQDENFQNQLGTE